MDRNSLYEQIEILRKEINDSIDENPSNVSNDKIIHKSNQLDKLIVEYQKILNKK